MSIGTDIPGTLVVGTYTPPLTASNPSGSYVVSFTNIVPPVRYDDNPWTTLEIQQAATLTGTYTSVDTQLLANLDQDPSNPAARNFTTSQATAQEGFFQLIFLDETGAAAQPIVQVMNQPSEIRPTVAELGAFMRARTVAVGSGGKELGTFTASTRPTGVEADQIIDQAVDAVLMQTGADIPDRLITQTRYAALLYAAQLVELTFYRNEVNRDQSAFTQYEALWKDTISGLSAAIADEDAASPTPGFFSVPIASAEQARFQAIIGATNPATGVLDPTQLPVDLWWPRGPGGIPSSFAQLYPWLTGDNSVFVGGMDFEMADLEMAD